MDTVRNRNRNRFSQYPVWGGQINPLFHRRKGELHHFLISGWGLFKFFRLMFSDKPIELQEMCAKLILHQWKTALSKFVIDLHGHSSFGISRHNSLDHHLTNTIHWHDRECSSKDHRPEGVSNAWIRIEAERSKATRRSEYQRVQPAHDVVSTLKQRHCNVKTFYRRWNNV